MTAYIKTSVRPQGARHNANDALGFLNFGNFQGTSQNFSEEEEKKDFTSFCQLTQPIACGRASATLPNVIHLCQTKCQRPPDRDALSTPYA